MNANTRQGGSLARSMGVKLIIVGVLALAMTVPALIVYALISDRQGRAREVENDIQSLVGGPQAFAGPILLVPYQVATASSNPPGQLATRYYVIFPAHANAKVNVTTEVRHRSLFHVPVYQASTTLESTFDLTEALKQVPSDIGLHWDNARLAIATGSPRGALTDPTLSVGTSTAALQPVSLGDFSVKLTDEGQAAPLNFFWGKPAELGITTTANGAEQLAQKFSVTATLKFSGAQWLAVLPYGNATEIQVHTDWPDPSFGGAFAAVTRNISSRESEAQWSVPFIARGSASQGESETTLGKLASSPVTVAFSVLADPYQSVTRSVKYAILFFVFVFLTYFMFEVSTGQRVHPAQYILVGVAQIVFYLLLLAFAERVGFGWGFLIGAAATVSLISVYAGWVFGADRWRLRAFVIFSLLYAMIYLLLRLEDEALLLGSIACFIVIAAVMYATRHIDWYGATTGPTAQNSSPEEPR